MIEYFISPLAGVGTAFSRSEVDAFRQQAGMQFRKKPAGVVRTAIGEGTLDLPTAAAGGAFTTKPYKFTLTSPYMLAKSLLDLHYRDMRQLAFAIAEVFREQVAESRCRRPANRRGQSRWLSAGWRVGGRRAQPRFCGVSGAESRASLLWQLRRPDRPTGPLQGPAPLFQPAGMRSSHPGDSLVPVMLNCRSSMTCDRRLPSASASLTSRTMSWKHPTSSPAASSAP